MCLYINKKDRQQPIKVAETDITCYKILEECKLEGYIHTYKTKIVAEEMLDICQNRFENDCHLFECKIPAGTEYYEGLDDNFLATYASDKIVFVSEI